MKLNNNTREIDNNLGAVDNSAFTIENSAKMFDILSNRIYTDVPRAIIRELSCNAIDANIEAGVSEPFNVYLPTESQMSLIIEDNGIGMTHEDVLTVYKSYGKSTKSSSDKLIGALGLGGKTPLAYTNQFTLVTARDGTANSYIIFKDEAGIPNVTHVSSEPSEQTGTKVELIVKRDDIRLFTVAAIKVFIFFDQMPNILRGEDFFYNTFSNTFRYSYNDYDEKIARRTYNDCRIALKNDYIWERNNNIEQPIKRIIESYNTQYGVIMGQVFYNVNEQQLSDKKSVLEKLAFPNNNSQVKRICHIPMGSVSIQPSREALNYDKRTISYLYDHLISYYNDWADEVSKYDAASYIKDFGTIRHAAFITYDFEGGKNKDIYEKCIKYLHDKIIKGNTFLYSVQERRPNSYEMQNLLIDVDTNPNIATSLAQDIFEKMLIQENYTSILVVDDALCLEKIAKAHGKMVDKNRASNWFAIPAALRHKMDGVSFRNRLLLVDEKHEKIMKTLFSQISLTRASTIVIPKETVERKQRTSGIERDMTAKCWDVFSKKYFTVDEIAKLSKKAIITYECFEGTPGERGWWFTPKFDELAKNGVTTKHVGVESIRSGAYHTGHNKIDGLLPVASLLPMPQHHFLIDWKFFKGANVYYAKNWEYIDNYAIKMIKKDQKKIIDQLSALNLWGLSLFSDSKVARQYLDQGRQIFSSYYLKMPNQMKVSDFDSTMFGQECLRKIAEEMTPDTTYQALISKFRKFWDYLLTLKGNKGYDELITTFQNARTQLNKLDSVQRPEFIKPLHTQYPMLRLTNSLNSDMVKAVTEYITKEEIIYA